MGVTFLFIGIFVIGIILSFVGFLLQRRNKFFDRRGIFHGIGCACLFVGFVVSVSLSVGIMVVQTRRITDYERTEARYNVLFNAISADEKNYFLLYEDIIEYNNSVIEQKRGAESVWTNLLYNDLVGELPLIVIKEK